MQFRIWVTLNYRRGTRYRTSFKIYIYKNYRRGTRYRVARGLKGGYVGAKVWIWSGQGNKVRRMDRCYDVKSLFTNIPLHKTVYIYLPF